MKQLEKELKKLENKEKAKQLGRFFKTKPGEYGEGDMFLGISVPKQKEIVKKFWTKLLVSDIGNLLNSKIHEKRLIALLILIEKYKKACKENNELEKEKIFDFYLKNVKKNINNWDLVDLSAPNIVGDFLLDNKDRKILYKLAKSDNLWERRVAVLATFAFIRKNRFEDSLKISKLLLKDKHDLIHKSVGWMLREIGKRDVGVLRGFLKEHSREMPRVMLRYAIEKFDEEERGKWMEREKK